MPRTRRPRGGWLAGLLLLAGAAAVIGDDGRAVRITLADGETVEGTLTEFGERRYVVETPDGVREVAEDDVVRLEVLDGADAPAGRTAIEVAGSVLRRARASGALRERVLGERCFRFAERVPEESPFADSSGGPGVKDEALVRVRVALEGGTLALAIDTLPWRDGEPTGRASRWT